MGKSSHGFIIILWTKFTSARSVKFFTAIDLKGGHAQDKSSKIAVNSLTDHPNGISVVTSHQASTLNLQGN